MKGAQVTWCPVDKEGEGEVAGVGIGGVKQLLNEFLKLEILHTLQIHNLTFTYTRLVLLFSRYTLTRVN